MSDEQAAGAVTADDRGLLATWGRPYSQTITHNGEWIGYVRAWTWRGAERKQTRLILARVGDVPGVRVSRTWRPSCAITVAWRLGSGAAGGAFGVLLVRWLS